PKSAPDFFNIDGSAFKGEARIASDDEQRFEQRKRRNDLLNHSVREVFLLRIAAHVLKRQHGDGRLVREWWGRTQPIAQRAISSRAYGKSADRLGNVLELLFAPVLEAKIELALDLAVHLFGNQGAAWIGCPFE